jgi:glycosyltransferase involved in cell wall biosynthesis
LLPGNPEICFGMGVKMTPEHYVNIADRVHLVNIEHYNAAIKKYSDSDKFYLIPNPGSESKTYKKTKSKVALRSKFNIKTEKVLLSVGAINSNIKRMDYVVTEASKLDDTWTLVLHGSPNEEDIIDKGRELLGDRFIHLFVSPESVSEVFYMADISVLASTIEGFGNVTIEAMQNGVPPIVHDRDLNRWILKDDELLIDMLEENELYNFIMSKQMSWFENKGVTVSQVYKENYSWEALGPLYLSLFNVN